MFVQGSHTFAMFYVHTLHEKQGIPIMYTHITLTIFTQYVKNGTVGCMLALYGPSIHVHVATCEPSGKIRL